MDQRVLDDFSGIFVKKSVFLTRVNPERIL
jgi:hypothetical protein